MKGARGVKEEEEEEVVEELVEESFSGAQSWKTLDWPCVLWMCSSGASL